jgi:hypothetical protein
MAGGDEKTDGGKSAAAKRAERLDAELRANLKKRKDRARARAPKGNAPPACPENTDTGEV